MSTNTCYSPNIRNLSESMKGLIDQKILDTLGGADRVSANYLLSGINHGFWKHEEQTRFDKVLDIVLCPFSMNSNKA